MVHEGSEEWSGEIGGETRFFFDLEADPDGEKSLRLYKAERDFHEANNGNGNARKWGRRKKLKKPRPDFPLFIHRGTGRWCKKIDGKHRYFGYVESDPEGIEAEKLYRHDLPYLERGEQPPECVPDLDEYPDGLTLDDLCDEFLTEKDELLVQAELSRRSYSDYRRTCERLLDLLGKHRMVESLSGHKLVAEIVRLQAEKHLDP